MMITSMVNFYKPLNIYLFVLYICFIFCCQDEETPLHCAAARGNTDCVKALLSNRASINLLEKVSCYELYIKW